MNLLRAAIDCAHHFHAGEHFKYVEGPYFFHPKAVSERMHTVPEKVVALLHDVVENTVKKRVGKNPTSEQEEACIREVFDELRAYFRARKCSIEDLIPDIDILTKRVSANEDYAVYIAHIKEYARRTKRYLVIKVKKADLEDNSLPERNPPLNLQKEKDKTRLARYAATLENLNAEFPEIILRPPHSKRRKIRNWSRRPSPTREAAARKQSKLHLD